MAVLGEKPMAVDTASPGCAMTLVHTCSIIHQPDQSTSS